ncbi:septum formation initiator family protein [Nitriliruptoraceae bacterium ZYF776]|nr:septum formation initiator family protein [Profundirhabdus halotolerans]
MTTTPPLPPSAPPAEGRDAPPSPRRAPVVVQRVARVVAAVLRAVAAAPAGLRRFWRAARSGERPLAVVLAFAVVLAVVMLSGPFQRYVDGRDRVAALQAGAAALDDEIARLEQQRDDLQDPENVELLAREQQGYVLPGEVPYTLVPPEVERPTIGNRHEAADDEVDRPWYARAWGSVTGWFN